VYLIVSFFRSFLFFTALGQAILVFIVLWGELVISGYWLRFFLDGTISSLEGADEAPDVPDFDLKELFRTGLKGLGVALVYILPVVTVPLLPLGLLSLAYSDDTRAFDLVWAARAAARRPGPLLKLWPVLLLWMAIMVTLDVVLTILTFAVAGMAAVGGGGILVGLAITGVGLAVLAAVTAMFMTVIFRCVGMLGRYHPEYVESLPDGPGAVRIAASFAVALACTFVVFMAVVPRILEPLVEAAD
jgi:hypothetical protein